MKIDNSVWKQPKKSAQLEGSKRNKIFLQKDNLSDNNNINKNESN